MDGNLIHIAYVVNDLKLGGAQMMILQLAAKLNREVYDVTVYYLNRSYGDQGNLESEYKKANIKTVCLAQKRRASLLFATVSLFKLWKYDNPSVVHAHLPYAVLASSFASLLLPRIKLIVHEHQSPSHFSWKIRLLRKLLRPFADLTICYSEGVERDIFQLSTVVVTPPEKSLLRSFTIYNGIDIETISKLQTAKNRETYRHELNCNTDDVLIVSVARFIYWKGQSELVEAFLLLAPSMQNTKLCLVGSGPTLEILRKRVNDAGYTDRVLFMGDRKDALSLLGAADIVSLAYKYPKGKEGDAVGIAGCEALASGLPVVAAAGIDCITGLQNGKNIVLVDPSDTKSFSEALLELCLDKTVRQELGVQARLFAARNLDWRSIVPIYERIYLLLTKV